MCAAHRERAITGIRFRTGTYSRNLRLPPRTAMERTVAPLQFRSIAAADGQLPGDGAIMFLIDDLLTAPGKAVMFVFQEMVRKAQEELLDDDSVKKELQEIYNLLSSGKISEAEFEG